MGGGGGFYVPVLGVGEGSLLHFRLAVVVVSAALLTGPFGGIYTSADAMLGLAGRLLLSCAGLVA